MPIIVQATSDGRRQTRLVRAPAPARVAGLGPTTVSATSDGRPTAEGRPLRRAAGVSSAFDWDEITGWIPPVTSPPTIPGELPPAKVPPGLPTVSETECEAREQAAFDRGVASERQNLILSTAVGAAISAVVGGGITWILFR